MGVTSAVFLLARQAYLTEAAPAPLRARAMSTLGGVHRVGLFLGPFVGAPIVQAWGPRAAYVVAVAAGLLAGAVAWGTVDVTARYDARARRTTSVRVRDVVRDHRRVLLTVGVGVLVIGIARATRVAVVPLWAESVGLSAAQTSLVFGVAGGVEMLLFYPAGSVMDRFGRVWVAVPTVVVLGLGTLVLPLTTTLAGVALVAVVMGVANGMGSGIVMTLGADVAPEAGRAQFLGAWRLVSLVGLNGGPLLVSLLATVAGLATACVAVGGLIVVGGLWLVRWVPVYDPRRRDAPNMSGDGPKDPR